MSHSFSHVAVAAAALALATGCERAETPPQKQAQPSPNASILPAPLDSAGELSTSLAAAAASGPSGIPADSAGRLIVREAEPPPPVPVNVQQPLDRDTLSTKDVAGLSLKGEWVWADLPPRPPIPELSAEGLRAASLSTALKVVIDLGYAGRMRLEVASASFPLPSHTEFRSRSDLYGHVLIWPNGSTYRSLAPGSVRAIFAERRADVTPLTASRSKPAGKGNVLGYETIRSQVSSPIGLATLEQASIVGSGLPGVLLCRFLLEFVAVDPATDICRKDHVPLAARYEWVDGGSLSFKIDALENKLDIAYGSLVVPPAGAEFKPGELPPQSSGVFLDREQLEKLRTRPVPRAERPPKGAPGEGLTAINNTDTLRYLLVDGVPVAWVQPHSSRYIIGPQSGRYSVAWRDFFGMSTQAPALVDLPARVELGVAADAGP